MSTVSSITGTILVLIGAIELIGGMGFLTIIGISTPYLSSEAIFIAWIFLILFAMIPIVGGVFALRRRRPMVVLICSIVTMLIAFNPLSILFYATLVPIVLVASSWDEFDMYHDKSSRRKRGERKRKKEESEDYRDVYREYMK